MRKGNAATLVSVLAIALVATVIGMGTTAYFSETEAAPISVTAGTVNLKLRKPGGSWSDGLTYNLPTNWAPGDKYTVVVELQNVGNTGMENLFVTGDNLYGSPDKTLSDVIHITDVSYTDRGPGGTTQITVHPAGGTYYETVFGDKSNPFTLRELANGLTNGDKMGFCWGTSGLHGDYLPANGAPIDLTTIDYQTFTIEFTFDVNAGNSYQGKSAGFDLVFKGTDEPTSFVWYPPA